MITIEQLVEQVRYDFVNSSSAEVTPDKDVIKSVLEETEIEQLSRTAKVTVFKQKLTINKLYIRGHKWHRDTREKDKIFEYKRTLLTGMNGWIADNSSGKSSILKLVMWAVSGEKLQFKADVESWIDSVAVEIEIADTGTFTVLYMPDSTNQQVNGAIYNNNLDDVLRGASNVQITSQFNNREDMAKYIDQIFGVSFGLYKATTANTLNQREQNSLWNVYSQAIFIGSDQYEDYLFPYSYRIGKRHQEVLGAYLGLDNFTQAISKLRQEYDESDRAYRVEREYVLRNATDVNSKIDALLDEQKEIDRRLDELEHEQSVRIDPTYIHTLHEDVVKAQSKLLELNFDEAALLKKMRDVKDVQHQNRKAKQHLTESIEVKLFLTQLRVTRCPHCTNEISPEALEKELETKVCGVCHSQLKPLSSEQQIQQQQNLLAELEDKIKKQTKVLKATKKQLEDVNLQVSKLKEESQTLFSEYKSIAQQTREGIGPEIKRLIEQKGYLAGRLNELQVQTEESQTQRLEALKLRRDILKSGVSVLQNVLKRQNRNTLDQLSTLAVDYCRQFGVQNLESIIIKDQFELQVKQSGRILDFRNMEASEALRIKIAFQLALLVLHFRENIGRHPGLIIIDAPGGAEMNDDRLTEMLSQVTKIAHEFGDQIQILIASTRDELTNLFSDRNDRIEYRGPGEPIF